MKIDKAFSLKEKECKKEITDFLKNPENKDIKITYNALVNHFQNTIGEEAYEFVNKLIKIDFLKYSDEVNEKGEKFLKLVDENEILINS